MFEFLLISDLEQMLLHGHAVMLYACMLVKYILVNMFFQTRKKYVLTYTRIQHSKRVLTDTVFVIRAIYYSINV